jgi:hypothetical protein
MFCSLAPLSLRETKGVRLGKT